MAEVAPSKISIKEFPTLFENDFLSSDHIHVFQKWQEFLKNEEYVRKIDITDLVQKKFQVKN